MATRREQADQARAVLTDPIQKAIDHAHWLGVHRRVRTASQLEDVLKAARRMAHDIEGQLARGDVRHSCEAELQNRPDYSISQGIPAEFNCSCGRVWRHYDDEAFGGGWSEVDGKG